ncbi:MAG: glycogen debranching N-terminal domain-containing protein [Vulcanimicrobiota bacterium]
METTLSSLQPGTDDKFEVLKANDSFVILTDGGDIRLAQAQGLFHRGCRFLDRYRARLAEAAPHHLCHRLHEDRRALTCHLINRDHRDLSRGSLYAKRNLRLQENHLEDRWEITNLTRGALDSVLNFEFSTDFADIFEIRQVVSPLDRTIHREVSAEGCTFSYRGQDGRLRRCRLECRGGKFSADGLTVPLHLEPGESLEVVVRCTCWQSQGHNPTNGRAWLPTVEITTSNDSVNRWLEVSELDLRMLITHTRYGPYPYAGTPWFADAFGRDALVTGLRTLWLWPGLSRGILRFLAAHQARDEDPTRVSQPGKILHELRTSERANCGDVPYGCYYGAVDSTPLFVVLAGAYLERTGDVELLEEIRPNILAAADWMENCARHDEHGFLTYQSQPDGLIHQGWRDADDAVYHRNGQQATGRIALLEVQAYHYAALRALSQIARKLGDFELEERSRQRAQNVRLVFEDVFWDEELQYYVMAVDGEGAPCRILSSAPGHALWMGIVSEERAEKVASQLASSTFWTGWGFRTIGRNQPLYSPLSYHNGSVWPHDTVLCAEGLARYGFRRLVRATFAGLLEASAHFPRGRLPELFCGFSRSQTEGSPIRYPNACSPQAWAAIAPLSLLSSCLGLHVQANPARLTLTHPQLPAGLKSVTVEDLQVGEALVSFTVRSHEEAVSLKVNRQQGHCDVDLLL